LLFTGAAVVQLVEALSRFRFPIVLLEFFININLPAAVWSWDRHSL